MEKQLYGYLKYLEQEKKSKSSIKNYKADVRQFLKWKLEVSPETSISYAFSLYIEFLESKYSNSSISRKGSSIKSFIKYAYPFENKNVESTNNSNRHLRRLTAFSLSLSVLLILFIATPLFANSASELVDLKVNTVKIKDSHEEMFEDKEGIVLSVSAPSLKENTTNSDFSIPCNYE